MADKKRHVPVLPDTLRMVAWEITRSCNLACVHCRASSLRGPYEGELSESRSMQLLDEIAATGKPVVILTGGEPLLRQDVFKLAAYGDRLGLRMVLATNGTLVTDKAARKMIDSGIRRVSISIDGMDAGSHDAFRGQPGAFAGAMAGIEALKKAGMEFQINTTVTRANFGQIREMLELAVRLGAAAHHIFLLVPTGRGKDLADWEIGPDDYEETLEWFFEAGLSCPIQTKVTCAPHYFRIYSQRKKERPMPEAAPGSLHAMTRGCLGGSAFCFISHSGQVQPCGYLEIDCGQVKERPFGTIWKESAVFSDLRHLDRYKGKCGRCEFITVCGGCRARAYEKTGDYLSEEPLCAYDPRR